VEINLASLSFSYHSLFDIQLSILLASPHEACAVGIRRLEETNGSGRTRDLGCDGRVALDLPALSGDAVLVGRCRLPGGAALAVALAQSTLDLEAVALAVEGAFLALALLVTARAEAVRCRSDCARSC